MSRDKPYYSKSQIRNLISEGKLHITSIALASAKKSFGWGTIDIQKALLALPQACCCKSVRHFYNPSVWVDHYKAPNIFGEYVYTHFHVEDGILIVNSFKEK